MKETEEYYVYVYLDPTKKGSYLYKDIKFSYEPFYIGKGKGRRKYFHLWAAKQKDDSGNPHKFRRILKILNNHTEPIIMEISSNLTSEKALLLEAELIAKIGKSIDKQGPLTNITDGGESNPMYNQEVVEKVRKHHVGVKRSAETRAKISERAKERHPSAEHKKHISESLLDNCRAGKAVVCSNIESGKVLTFPSVLRASYSLNIREQTIYRFIKKGNKKGNVKGWKFSYERIF